MVGSVVVVLSDVREGDSVDVVSVGVSSAMVFPGDDGAEDTANVVEVKLGGFVVSSETESEEVVVSSESEEVVVASGQAHPLQSKLYDCSRSRQEKA